MAAQLCGGYLLVLVETGEECRSSLESVGWFWAIPTRNFATCRAGSFCCNLRGRLLRLREPWGEASDWPALSRPAFFSLGKRSGSEIGGDQLGSTGINNGSGSTLPLRKEFAHARCRAHRNRRRNASANAPRPWNLHGAPVLSVAAGV